MSRRRWEHSWRQKSLAYIKQGRQSTASTCRRWRSVVLYSSWGGEQTSWRESDVIQADVTLWTSAHLSLEHDLKVRVVAQRDLPHLPVVALISRQVQEEMKMTFAFPEDAEGPNAVSWHVEVKTHLDGKGEMCQSKVLTYRVWITLFNHFPHTDLHFFISWMTGILHIVATTT